MTRSEAAKKAINAAGGISIVAEMLERHIKRVRPDEPMSFDRAYFRVNAWQRNGIPAVYADWMSKRQGEVSKHQMYPEVFRNGE